MDARFSGRLEELFHAALDQEATARDAFLQSACTDDPLLQRELRSLLAADERTGNLLEQPACELVLEDQGQVSARRGFAKGQRIGGYELVRLLASGGMGDVYEAVQSQPRRTVALKVLRGGFASVSDRRRFQYEAELLARLHHPNIARVYEAGIHEEGLLSVPYFALEYIPEARNIVDYARALELNTSDRLAVFLKVCAAVQHGHQKGIVHRDLKPGNLLVDSAGEPRVIDYGVALAADGEVRLTTQCTSVGSFLGTLQYMSPEQLRGRGDEVDTRSDVYALGLILFELLAGRRPYELTGKGLREALQTLEEEPVPSLVPANRAFQGDLDTIVATAMAKDRTRRYQSAADLASDIERFLDKKPIQVRPAGLFYVARKFAARHRAMVAGFSLALLGLAVGLTAALVQYGRAVSERNRAILEARKAERFSDFLQGILTAADPFVSDASVSVREAVDRAAQKIETDLRDDPEVAADIHRTIGRIYERLRRSNDAQRHLQVALAEYQRLYGKDSDQAVSVMSDLAWSAPCDQKEKIFNEVLRIRTARLGLNHPATALTRTYVAGCLISRKDFIGAEQLAREALASFMHSVGEDNENTAYAILTLAECLKCLERYPEAEEYYLRGLSVQRRILGDDHYQVAVTLKDYALLMRRMNRTEEMTKLREEADRIMQKRIGS
jgi:tetratricopeptide (TPR) repeat protein